MKKQSSKQNFIPILASGKGWLAVDKPAGMSVHNDPGVDLGSLLAVRLQTDAVLQAATGLSGKGRLDAVHRLDRETSGVILMAGDRFVFSHFAAQFEARSVKKIYAVILHGHLSAADSAEKRHAWKWPLTKTPGGRKNPGGRGPKKACATLVRVLDHSKHYTLAECQLLTGRKHQIRRHAKLAGHPVVGDPRYGSKRALDFLQSQHNFKRLALHATHLEIQLPDGSPVTIHSPELPGEMRRLFTGDDQTDGLAKAAQPQGHS
jgi:23S rRNA-/tRNA-specific pseudouridylate synthase